uniref:Nucleoprotein n=1 Tax=European wheat striate mosaic virus TaxID=2661631 RepID=A0A5P9K6B4_9VIRU|nr:pC3 [European wheat striate mosaic virus]QFU19967.1 pC3 [European wheat striate mosaic virus]QFU19975.1 pC3 [European wheat striate mosaic virus]QFU19977.1 pC3 [European wheat striate mosaic virus]
MTFSENLQKAVANMLALAISEKTTVLAFAADIAYDGYNPEALFNLLRTKGGADFEKDMLNVIVMRYVRGPAFVTAIKRLKKDARKKEIDDLVSKYGLTPNVGDKSDAATPGRIAQLFPQVSAWVVSSIPNMEMAVEDTDLHLPGFRPYLWDFVSQFLVMDSVTKPHCTDASLTHIVFTVNVIHNYVNTQKTMPAAARKKKGLTNSGDLMKHCIRMLVISCQSKVLTNEEKKKEILKIKSSVVKDGVVGDKAFIALASCATKTLAQFPSEVREQMVGVTKLLDVMLDNISATQTEAEIAIKKVFGTENK